MLLSLKVFRPSRLYIFLISSLSCFVLQSQVTLIDDPLQGGATTGLQEGGQFTAEGYVPGSGNNHILYEIPSVREGYLEFEIKGMFNEAGDPEGNVGLRYVRWPWNRGTVLSILEILNRIFIDGMCTGVPIEIK